MANSLCQTNSAPPAACRAGGSAHVRAARQVKAWRGRLDYTPGDDRNKAIVHRSSRLYRFNRRHNTKAGACV
jgi:hypothetical protein